MNRTNIVRTTYWNGNLCHTAPVWQYDYGLVLKLDGLNLPAAYEVHFTNADNVPAIVQIGNAEGVAIPDQLLRVKKNVIAHIYLHTADADGETVKTVIIPVNPRAAIGDVTPTPTQQTAIEEAIKALNSGVEATQQLAEQIPEMVDEAIEEAKNNKLTVHFTITAPEEEGGSCILTADKTPAEVYAAYEEGKQIVGEAETFNEDGPIIVPMAFSTAAFPGDGTVPVATQLMFLGRYSVTPSPEFIMVKGDYAEDYVWPWAYSYVRYIGYGTDKLDVEAFNALGARIIYVADPTLVTDAANKGYVDGRIDEHFPAVGKLVAGTNTQATRNNAVATGNGTTASGTNAHAEGNGTTASGTNAHSEGSNTVASGNQSHAEGSKATASGTKSHAEGDETTASGSVSHAEGSQTVASGSSSHAEGENTVANHLAQHVFGRFNAPDDSTEAEFKKGKFVEIVGNGTIYTTGEIVRSNARTLDWDGNERLAGGLTLGADTGNEVSFTPAKAKEIALNPTARVTSLDPTELLGAQVIEVNGVPVYVSDPTQYPTYNLTQSGWYVFARITAPDGVTASNPTVTGAAGYVAGNNSLDVAVRFDVAAQTQVVKVDWNANDSETFAFKATDLAIRNLDYRTTFYIYDLAPYVTWEYALTTDETFVADKKYYTKDGDTYTLAEVTAGDAVTAGTYYNHSKLVIAGMARNVTYQFDEVIDCPSEIVLPSVADDGYGCWFEFRFRHSGSFSSTLLPEDPDVKVATEHTQAETAGMNMVDLHYQSIAGVKIWRFMNTHSTIPTT